MSGGPIRSVAVLGDGIVGLSAAAAFARALPQLQVTVVAAEPDPAALAELLPGSTSAIHRFHAAIGLGEAELIRAGAAMPRVAIRFEGWNAGGGGPWFHVDGEHGRPAGTIGFHHYWARARREGRALPYHRYAVAGAMAEAGKFVHPEPRAGSPLASYDYGLRLDPARYRDQLARHVAALRVGRAAARFSDVERHPDDSLAALTLVDGTRVAADLFIDASGPRATLLRLFDERFEDWGDRYPARWLGMRDAASLPASPLDRVRRTKEGWAWEAPLLDRTIAGTLSARPGAEAISLRLGRRPSPWIRNVLAIGDAAVALDPLHWLPLHVAHEDILRALELLPGRSCERVETGEYNRRALLAGERLRDFQLLHHRQSGWGAADPPGLAHMLQQFEKRGRLPSFDEDSLAPESWLAALLGLGVVPQAMDPLADTISADLAEHGMAELAERAASLADRLPDYGSYLARI